MRKILSLFAALLFAGSMMATDYHLSKVTSVSAGKTYAFVRNGKGLTTTSSSALKTENVNFATIDGSQAYLWKLVAAEGGFKMQNLSKPTEKVSGVTYDAFLRNSSSTSLSIVGKTDDKNVWTIAFSHDTALISIAETNRFLGEQPSPNQDTYKAYAISDDNLKTYGNNFFVYELVEGASVQPSIVAEKLDIKTAIVSALPFALDTSIVVTADNLTEDITVTHTGSNLNTLPASLDKAGGKLTFKIFAAAEGKFSDTIVLASSGLTVKAAIEGSIVDPDGEGTKESPFTLADLEKINSGVSGKWWVQGFILGCATTGGVIAEEPDSSSVLLGVTANATEGIAVQLAKSSNAEKETREALAIKGSTGKIGKEVKVYGKLETYFGTNGVKNTSDYEWVESELPKSTDATIKSVTINGKAIAEKDGVFAYELPADQPQAEVAVAFVLNDANATADHTSPFNMTVPAPEVDPTEEIVTVTAEDGTTTKEYTFRVSQEAAPAEKSHDASVKSLTINDEVVVAIDNVYEYTVPAESNIAQVMVEFELSDEKATASPESGFALSVPASSDDEPSVETFTVTAEDGETSVMYTVRVLRAAPGEKSHVVTIKSLTIEGKAITEDNGKFAYEVPANENLSQVSVAFELTDAKASADKTSPFMIDVPESHDADPSVATIKVTAEDGTTTKEYTVTITRGEAQGIEDIVLTEKAQKVVVDGAVYVIRDNKMFNVTGTRVR